MVLRFHQLDDEGAAEKISACRAGLHARQSGTARWRPCTASLQPTCRRSWPTRSRITALHQDMRNFYCSYVFNEKAFGPADFEQRPRYQSGLAAQDVPLVQLGVLLLVSLAFAAAGLATLRRVNVD